MDLILYSSSFLIFSHLIYHSIQQAIFSPQFTCFLTRCWHYDLFLATILLWCLFNPISFCSPIFKKLLLKLSVLQQFKVHSKIEGKIQRFLTGCLLPSLLYSSSSVLAFPTRVARLTIDEPTLIHHNHLKFTVYITVHSWHLLPR